MLAKIKSIFFLFIILSFINISNLKSIEPDVFVQSTVNRASQILRDNLTIDQKIEKLKTIAQETVDINGIGMYTLGAYRKSLNEDQKEQYKELFKNYFLKSFAGRLVGYSDAKIAVLSEEIKNEKYTIVNTKLIGTSDRPEVKIDWRVYTKDPENFLIRDLIIEGLSLARTQKEEFNSIIINNDNNIEALFENINKFLEN